MADFKSALVLRRNAEGQVRIQGEAPGRHVFPASFLERELGRGDDGAVQVEVVVRTTGGQVRYRMRDFERLDDGRPNLSGWVCQRIEG